MLKILFIPNKEKKKRSKALLPHSMIGYSMFLIFTLLFTHWMTFGNILGYATDININDLLKYTNQKRAEAGLEALKLNPVLSQAAGAKAEDMFKYDYWAHTSPNNKEPWDFIHDAGYEYLYAGENLAVDFAHSEGVVIAWYNSPSHRDNLMSDKYTEIGFAVANGELQGRKTTLVVQMFGYPKSQYAIDNRIAQSQSDQAVTIDVPGESDALISYPNLVTENTFVDNISDQLNTETIQVPNEIASSVNTAGLLRTSQFISIILSIYLIITFIVDGYYVKKEGILRVSGHTILHIILLIFVMVGIWYTNIGLVL